MIVYAFKTICIAGFLWGYYALFLKNRAFHLYNRLFLLSIIPLSLLLPVLKISSSIAPALHIFPATSQWLDAVEIRPANSTVAHYLSTNQMAFVVYTVVCIFFMLPILMAVLKLNRLKKQRIQIDRTISLSLTDIPGTPFTFFRTIYWNPLIDAESTTGNLLLQHEIYHARHLHSLDLLFTDFARAIFWFNPFFILVSREIRAVHEFAADQYAAATADKQTYAEQLVYQTIYPFPFTPVNSFFNHHIKRRITMIIQKQKWGWWPRLLALPIIATIACLFAFKNPSSPLRQQTLDQNVNKGFTGSNTKSGSAGFQQGDSTPGTIFTKVEQEAEYPGGQQAWIDFLIKNMKYPVEAQKKEIQGDVIVKFLIEKNGTISEVTAISGPEQLRASAVDIVRKSGRWKPAQQNGQTVRSYKMQPIKYRLAVK